MSKDSEFGVPAELRKTLSKKMIEEGWDNIRHFVRGTNVPFSLETVRRAFNPCPYKNLDVITLAIIMQHLSYSQKEIKMILSEYFPPNDPTIRLIGDSEDQHLSSAESALIQAYRKLISKDPACSSNLADYIVLLGKGAGVRLAAESDALRR